MSTQVTMLSSVDMMLIQMSLRFVILPVQGLSLLIFNTFIKNIQKREEKAYNMPFLIELGNTYL